MRDPQGHTNLVRYLPVAGIVLTIVAIAGFFGVLSASRHVAFGILAGLATLPYGGKEAALPVGMAAGAGPALMGVFIFLVDAAAVCFLYPPIHYAVRRWMEKENIVGAYLRYVRDKALTHEGWVRRYGTAGLFVFMLIPFAINGPLVGAILGRMMGLRARQIVPAVIVAIGATTLMWTAIYAFGFLVIAHLDPNLPKWIAGGVILLVIVHAGIAFWRFRGREEGGGGGDEPPAASARVTPPSERAVPEPL